MEECRLTFGCFQLNRANGVLLRAGEPIPVGQRGVRLLEALLQRRGEVLTRAELLDAGWPDTTVEEANLSVQIASLRKALGPAPGGGDWIVTIPRVGYRLIPDDAAQGRQAQTGLGKPGKIARRWWMLTAPGSGPRWITALAAVALIAIVGFVHLRSEAVDPRPAGWTNPTIAVLPFDVMTGNAELGYFGDGVSEDIISMLARFPDITVVSRNSSFRYKGQPIDIRQVGEELGASHVLEGSIRRDADRLRIVAQLIDTKSGNHVWAERFDRTGTDPWALQDEVTDRIVGTLVGNRGMIKRAEYRDAWGKDSANLLEYDYYLRSTDLMMARTPETHGLATAVWEEGLARFPDSSLLKVLGANLHLVRFMSDWTEAAEEEFRHAGALTREAMAQPNLPPMTRRNALHALAFVNLAEGNSEQGFVAAEAAIALSPYDATVYLTMAEIPIAIGRPRRALEWIDRAAGLLPERDPLQAVVLVYRAWALTADRQAEAALAVLADPRIAPLRAVAPLGRYVRVLNVICLMHLERVEDAREEMADLLRFDPEFSEARFRQRNLHFDPSLVEWAGTLLAAAGLPQ